MKIDLGDLNAFVAVARAKGFREGARTIGSSASGLSEAVRRLCAADFRAGRCRRGNSSAMVKFLEPWWPSFPGPFLYYSGRRLVPAPLRAFIDFIKTSGEAG